MQVFFLSPHVIVIVDRFFGATTLQAWSYFAKFRDDKLWIKVVVRKPQAVYGIPRLKIIVSQVLFLM